MFDKKAVLKYIKSKKRPLSFKALSKRFCDNRKATKTLKSFLKKLIQDGKIIRTKRGHYGNVSEMNLITGYFEAHKGGYGFVINEKPNTKDIYIPFHKTSGAMNSDRVVSVIEYTQRREGRIVRILERAHNRVVGRLKKADDLFYLQPKLRSIPFDIVLTQKSVKKADVGDLVIVQLTTFPDGNKPPVGKVIKKLNTPETPESEINSVIDEFNLPKKFTSALTNYVKSLPEGIPEDCLKNRKDLRGLKAVTIDGETAKDFDDALSIEETQNGYKLFVHIADVGYYVPWDSPVDLEAKKRGTSVYFPNKVIPMLPKTLSENLCSLKQKVDRLTFTAEMDFDKDGNQTGARFYKSVVNINERMTYTKVKAIIVDKDQNVQRKYKQLLYEFELMETLCRLLKAKRIKRGTLDFDLPEPEIIIGLKGELEDIVGTSRNFAHELVEEFMIAANEAVAGFLEKNKMPCMYRIHEEPEAWKVHDISTVLVSAGVWKKGTPKPSDFPQIIKRAKGTIYEEMITYLLLRSLKQAIYSPYNVGHFGLASTCYCHFTSPIRRYPDLVVHRILASILENKTEFEEIHKKPISEKLSDIAFHSSRKERIAEEAEREVVNAYRTWFMKDKVNQKFAGTVIKVSPDGIKVRLNDYYIDGFVHVSSLSNDYYEFDDSSFSLMGKDTNKVYSIGMQVTVIVDRVDMDEREIQFSIVI